MMSTKKPQVTAVIPIRGGSKRCKHKSIRPFGDTTLLELRINILKRVKGIDRIQVNSESELVLNMARELGVETFKRDPIYGSDEADGKMVYKCLSEACPTEIMLIAFTPTPFVSKDVYEDCIDIFHNTSNDSVLTVQRMHEYMFNKDKRPVNFDPLKTCKSQDLPKYYKMTFGVTVVNTSFVREHHSIWTPNPYFYEVDDLTALDIDTNMDFMTCELLYRNNMKTIQDIEYTMNGYEYNKQDIPRDVYLGAVYDALNMTVYNPMDYVLDIKPITGYTRLIHGPALTLAGRKITKHENYQEMDHKRFEFYNPILYKDSPIVLLQSNDNIISHTGDITSQIFQKLGAVGYITDGIARDVERIEQIKFPVFCKGVNPIDAISNRWAYTEVNIPITIQNLIIYPNDYIFASKDGVIVVPQDTLPKFLDNLDKIVKKERVIRRFVKETPKEDLVNTIREFIETNGRF